MQNINVNSHSESVDTMFFNPNNYQMLFSLLHDTLQSRFNIQLNSKTINCVKDELLSIMNNTYNSKQSMNLKTPMSISELNLVLNKKVLDVAVNTIPEILQQNISCRPKPASRLHGSINDAFSKIQIERNEKTHMPKNPLKSEHIQSTHNNKTREKNSTLEASASLKNNELELFKTDALAHNNTESDFVSSFNDTSNILSIIPENNSKQLSLADTIEMFHNENEEIEKNGKEFISVLNKKMQERETAFQLSTQLSASQEKTMKMQIEDDKLNAVQNVYPMDDTVDDSLPQSNNTFDTSLSSLSTVNSKEEENTKNNVVTWIEKETTVRLNSADRENINSSRYEYTIDTSLFGESMKHITQIKIKNMVIPSYEFDIRYSHTFDQYLTLDIPELNTHHVGSNTTLDNSQCMLFVDHVNTSDSALARDSIVLKNENDTCNLYANNIMRQLPRQLTIRVHDKNGQLYGNDLTKDDYMAERCQFPDVSYPDANTPMENPPTKLIIILNKPFIKNVQFKLGDTIKFIASDDGTNDGIDLVFTKSVKTYLSREEGHIIIGFGEVRTNGIDSNEWCKALMISNVLSGSTIPKWDLVNATELINDHVTTVGTFGNITLDLQIVNRSIQNTLSLVVTSKIPLNSSI